jgi:glycosyltransferase involved in cell wall biosynthesis
LPVCRGNSLTAQRLFDGLRSRGHGVRVFSSTMDAPEDLVSFAPDLIHSLHALQPHSWLSQTGLPGSCPWVITMTGTDYNTEVRPEAAQVLRDARALVVFHAEAAECVRKRFPEFADRVYVIAQGVAVPEDTISLREDVRREWNVSSDDIVFFMASGLRPVKNIGYALEAFARFRQKNPRARLLLAGPCLDEQESARILAAGERLEGFSYCGELPHERVLELMQAADVFLNTSLNEGMPSAVMEAMAAGLAVVATDVTGNRTLIESMRTGVLVPLHDPRVLVEIFEMLASRAEFRRTLGSRARDEVLAHYGCEAELEALEALYKNVLER